MYPISSYCIEVLIELNNIYNILHLEIIILWDKHNIIWYYILFINNVIINKIHQTAMFLRTIAGIDKINSII